MIQLVYPTRPRSRKLCTGSKIFITVPQHQPMVNIPGIIQWRISTDTLACLSPRSTLRGAAGGVGSSMASKRGLAIQ